MAKGWRLARFRRYTCLHGSNSWLVSLGLIRDLIEPKKFMFKKFELFEYKRKKKSIVLNVVPKFSSLPIHM